MLFSNLGRNLMLHRSTCKSYAMKSNQINENLHWNSLVNQKQRTAFHIAGHATSIYSNIKAKNLPRIFFKIMLKELNNCYEDDLKCYQINNQSVTSSSYGRRLTEMSLEDNNSVPYKKVQPNLTMPSIKAPLMVFEADIVNLLAGPLAEAKYVYDIDNELFSELLIDQNALKNYGGYSDLILVNDYLLSFSDCQEQRDDKLNELFVIAFKFIDQQTNWAAITKLAHSIIKGQQDNIDYEKVVSLFE
jgi:hypothetical protein